MDEDDESNVSTSAYQSDAGYTWEGRYEMSWDLLEEDELGLRAVNQVAERVARKRRQQQEMDARAIKRGMNRHLYLVIDYSKSMGDTDMKPSRLAVVLRLVELFIKEYFDQNPISQLGVIILKNSVAQRLTELSGNPTRHINALKNATATEGEQSLQNALETACASLVHVPKYGTREVLIISSSLSTCDPGDIFKTIEACKKELLRVSIIGLAASVRVCKVITDTLGGTYDVPLNEEHFKTLLFRHTHPPPSSAKMEASLVMMGFPKQSTGDDPHFCACHRQLKYGGYTCPQCANRFCELPIDCKICGLTLVSSPHLARSYHHLFPVPIYLEIKPDQLTPDMTHCYGCMGPLITPTSSLVLKCPRCAQIYCYDCDIFIHESLHNCPGCENGLQLPDNNNTTTTTTTTTTTINNTTTTNGKSNGVSNNNSNTKTNTTTNKQHAINIV